MAATQNVAPYEVAITCSDDETFSFSLPFDNVDGTPFDFASYAVEYVITRGGCPVRKLSEGNGVTVAAPNVSFRIAEGVLTPGAYEHAGRIRHRVTGDTIAVFDGPVTVGEGQF